MDFTILCLSEMTYLLFKLIIIITPSPFLLLSPPGVGQIFKLEHDEHSCEEDTWMMYGQAYDGVFSFGILNWSIRTRADIFNMCSLILHKR